MRRTSVPSTRPAGAASRDLAKERRVFNNFGANPPRLLETVFPRQAMRQNFRLNSDD
ncbi:MAG: hypothetical protein ACOCY0_03445 [Roseicyclus sp.]